jgi:predicted PhzF superfamily epimerase YddE/YHI9
MHVPLFIVDSFTTEVFRGNPAGVVLLSSTGSALLLESDSETSPQQHQQITNNSGGVPPISRDAAAAKVLWSAACSTSTLQSCASELNLSETVFVTPYPINDADSDRADTPASLVVVAETFLIRWFTPDREVGLCGHATLAAAHILFTATPPRFLGPGIQIGNVVKFYNEASGWVSVTRQHNSRDGIIDVMGATGGGGGSGSSSRQYVINFPLRTPHVLWNASSIESSAATDTEEYQQRISNVEAIRQVCESVGLTVDDAEELCLHDGSQKYLLVVKGGVKTIQRACPDIPAMREAFLRLHALPHALVPLAPLSLTITSRISMEARGNVESCHAASPQVASRHFAPWVGINEDPVTGAAHVVLVPYWLRRFHQELQRPSQEGDPQQAPLVDAVDQNGVPLDVPLCCVQASKRGGLLRCTARVGERLDIEGSATTFLSGTAQLPC